jgi:hypothetical protein
MEVTGVATAIQQYEFPAEFRRLGGMEADYIDLFTISTRDVVDASPERWARTVIEDVAGLGGQFIWRGVLGLRLEQGPPNERVGGWKIAGSGGDWIRLEASSWCMTAHLVLRLHESRVWAGTFVRYDNPVGRIIWTPASAVHRRLMPGLLEKTLRVRVRRSMRDATV